MIKIILSTLTVISILWASSVQAEEKDQQSYLELGIIASNLILPSIGYWRDRTGVRFTGMYLDEDNHEFQFNFGYEIKESENMQRTINLLTRWFVGSDPGADYRFASTGIAYGLNYKGFFLEIGLAVPWKDELGNLANDPVVPIANWGYIHRFR